MVRLQKTVTQQSVILPVNPITIRIQQVRAVKSIVLRIVDRVIRYVLKQPMVQPNVQHRGVVVITAIMTVILIFAAVPV